MNGNEVVALSHMGNCALLKGRQGHVWQPNANGQYEISARINSEGSYMELVAVVIW